MRRPNAFQARRQRGADAPEPEDPGALAGEPARGRDPPLQPASGANEPVRRHDAPAGAQRQDHAEIRDVVVEDRRRGHDDAPAPRRLEVGGLQPDPHDRADLELRQRLDQVRRQPGHGIADHAADTPGCGPERRDLVRLLDGLVHRELALQRFEHERSLRADDGDLDGHGSSLVNAAALGRDRVIRFALEAGALRWWTGVRGDVKGMVPGDRRYPGGRNGRNSARENPGGYRRQRPKGILRRLHSGAGRT